MNRHLGKKVPRVVKEYNTDIRYNIVACTKFYIETAIEKSFEMTYSFQYQIDLLLNISHEFFEYEDSKSEMKNQLVEIFANLISK